MSSLFPHKAKQSKAKQSKAKQSKAKQSKAKQSKAKQSKAKFLVPYLSSAFFETALVSDGPWLLVSRPFFWDDRDRARYGTYSQRTAIIGSYITTNKQHQKNIIYSYACTIIIVRTLGSPTQVMGIAKCEDQKRIEQGRQHEVVLQSAHQHRIKRT